MIRSDSNYYSNCKIFYMVFHFFSIFIGISLGIISWVFYDRDSFDLNYNSTLIPGECTFQILEIKNCWSQICKIIPNQICENFIKIPFGTAILGGIITLTALPGFFISLTKKLTIINIYLSWGIFLLILEFISIFLLIFFKADFFINVYNTLYNLNIEQGGKIFDLFYCCGIPRYNEGLNFTDLTVDSCSVFPKKYCIGCQNYTLGCQTPIDEFFGTGVGFLLLLISLVFSFQFFSIIGGFYLRLINKKLSRKYDKKKYLRRCKKSRREPFFKNI